MIMEGIVTISQDGKPIIETRNHLTKKAAIYMLSLITGGYTRSSTSYEGWGYSYYPAYGYRMSLGKEAYMPSFNIVALKSHVMYMPSISMACISNYATGGYIDVIFSAISPATNMISAFGSNLVNEIGLETYGTQYTNYGWGATPGAGAAYSLMGYISTTPIGANPPDFTVNAIDITKALTIEWKFRLQFVGD